METGCKIEKLFKVSTVVLFLVNLLSEQLEARVRSNSWLGRGGGLKAWVVRAWSRRLIGRVKKRRVLL